MPASMCNKIGNGESSLIPLYSQPCMVVLATGVNHGVSPLHKIAEALVKSKIVGEGPTRILTRCSDAFFCAVCSEVTSITLHI